MSAPTSRRLRVLLTNDDGPPTAKTGSSPFVYPFAKAVGKSYLIAEKTAGRYFYPDPKSEDGTQGETRELPRGVDKDAGEIMEWVLLDGTPATCASIALHNLFPPESFDLCISGGTLGAALAASLSGVNSIALSWGLMEGYKPASDDLVDAAVKVSCDVVKRLFELGWGEGPDKVDVYSVNVPLMPSILDKPEVHWTTMAHTRYGRLFKSISEPASSSADQGGPAAIPEPDESSINNVCDGDENLMVKDEHLSQKLHFAFAPDIDHLVNPRPEDMVRSRLFLMFISHSSASITLFPIQQEEGEDRTSLHYGGVSVTPVRAAFAEAPVPKGIPLVDGYKWRL
ncbi:SPOSA6832_00437, partial [Sporobolomyces salmonicolor]